MSEHTYSQGYADQRSIWNTALGPDLPEKLGPQCALEDWNDELEKDWCYTGIKNIEKKETKKQTTTQLQKHI